MFRPAKKLCRVGCLRSLVVAFACLLLVACCFVGPSRFPRWELPLKKMFNRLSSLFLHGYSCYYYKFKGNHVWQSKIEDFHLDLDRFGFGTMTPSPIPHRSPSS